MEVILQPIILYIYVQCTRKHLTESQDTYNCRGIIDDDYIESDLNSMW